MKKHLEFLDPKCFIFSVPARARTVDPLIKSQLLYQLSYTPIIAACLPDPRAGRPESNPALANEPCPVQHPALIPARSPKTIPNQASFRGGSARPRLRKSASGPAARPRNNLYASSGSRL